MKRTALGKGSTQKFTEVKEISDSLVFFTDQTAVSVVEVNATNFSLQSQVEQGAKIAAYGAPAKGNTLLNYCGIGTDILDYALEDLPSKQGLYAPGTHIPVVTRNYAETHLPDYYLLLAWNYTPAILEKEKEFREKGGKFIMPIGDNIKIL